MRSFLKFNKNLIPKSDQFSFFSFSLIITWCVILIGIFAASIIQIRLFTHLLILIQLIGLVLISLFMREIRGQIKRRDIVNKKFQDAHSVLEERVKEGADEAAKMDKSLKIEIEKRREMEKELFVAKEAGDVSNKAKSEFLCNISHELRTPMNGVIGMTGLLMDTPLNKKQREYANIVKNSAYSLLYILNDILDFSKIESGTLDIEVLNFNLHVALEEMCDLLAIRAEEKNLEFVYLIEPEVPWLLIGDPGRLRQILINLIENSIKFTKEGEISIRISLDSEDEKKARLRFSVSDTGIGIPENKRKILFDPFTQVDASATRKYGGIGLGLCICKELVKIMGGEIGFESIEGKGSCFWFTAMFEKQKDIAEPMPLLHGVIKDKRILIVDDNKINRDWLRILLSTWGCRCEEAYDGESAINKLREGVSQNEPFHIAIIDMQMPDIDGEILGKKIKEDSSLLDVKLVILTYLGNRGDAARLEKIGFVGYLTKPIKRSLLYACLITILHGKDESSTMQKMGIITQHVLKEITRRNIRILLAEDNIVNQKVAIKTLNKWGYLVDAVANGQEVLASLESIPYNLVLMDCQMPEMNGYDATRIIRNPGSRVKNHDIPIIAMTANSTKDDQRECINVGMNDFISKPINPKELFEVIEKWLIKKDISGNKAKIKSNQPSLRKNKSKERVLQMEENMDKELDNLNNFFDKAALLDRLLGDEEILKEIIKAYIEDLPNLIAALKDALDNCNTLLVRHHAHTLKGTSANVSATEIEKVACQIELAGKDGDIDKAASFMPQLEKLVEKTRCYKE